MDRSDSADLKKIITDAKRGDEAAFTELYRRYFVPVYRYVFSHVGSRSDADDLTQDAFVKILGSFSRYVETDSPPLAYFYTVARNTVIDWHRKKKTQPLEDDLARTLRDDTVHPEERAANEEEHKGLLELISHLPEGEREAIILKYVNDLSNKEIAAMMKKSEEAVRKLQSRGMHNLRKLLEHNHDHKNNE